MINHRAIGNGPDGFLNLADMSQDRTNALPLELHKSALTHAARQENLAVGDRDDHSGMLLGRVGPEAVTAAIMPVAVLVRVAVFMILLVAVVMSVTMAPAECVVSRLLPQLAAHDLAAAHSQNRVMGRTPEVSADRLAVVCNRCNSNLVCHLGTLLRHCQGNLVNAA